MLRAGFLRAGSGAPPRDPASMELLMQSVARAVDHRTAPAGPFTVQWEFPDAEPWHVRVDSGATSGPVAGPSAWTLEIRYRHEDRVDVVAGRLDPRRAFSNRP